MDKRQKAELNKLLHELIQLRYRDRCLRCGKAGWQMSHIYPKGRYRRMEFDEDNLLPLCYACHIGFWHKNPIEAHEWLKSVVPQETLDRLKLMSQANFKSPLDYKLIRLRLQDLTRKYGP